MADEPRRTDTAAETEALRERIRALEAERDELRTSLHSYRTLVDSVPIGLYTLSDGQKGTVSYVNPGLAELFGYGSVDEVIGTSSVLVYRDPADRVRLLQSLKETRFRRSSVAHFEAELVRVDNGEPVWCDLTVMARLDEDGNFGRVDGAVIDITERRKAEQALRESEERFRLFFETSGVGMVLADGEGHILRANPAFCRFLGYTEEKLRGRTFLEITHPDDRTESRRRMDVMRAGDDVVYRLKKRYLGADGAPRWARTTVSWLRGAGERPRHSVALVEDITEVRRMEEELAQVEKLRSLAVLSGGIAHDFNNLLTGVLGNVSVARGHLACDDGTTGEAAAAADAACEALAAAERATLRARDLTRQLQTFARGGAPRKRAAALAPIVTESASFCLRGSSVLWDAAVEPDLPAVDCDPDQLSQVFNNLFINARQAMPDGGRVRVSLSVAELSGAPSEPPLRPGRYVHARVADEGGGIPAEHLPHVFDPFYSTKKQGSGLGLASAWSIVARHDGHIGASSQVGAGTVMDIYLPASERPAEAREAAPSDWVDGAGRVLVMDDEPDVREVAARILVRAGYEVETVSDGDAALAAWRRARAEKRPFSLAVLDLTVPGGRGGGEVIEELRALDPDVRAIVSSGYSASPIMADPARWGFVGIVPKPYTAADLTSAVARAARATSPAPAPAPPRAARS